MIICHSETPVVHNSSFVCNACPCGEVELIYEDPVILIDCPHMVQVVHAGEVIEIHSLGVRQ